MKEKEDPETQASSFSLVAFCKFLIIRQAVAKLCCYSFFLGFAIDSRIEVSALIFFKRY
jgi:hypothetical protein